MSLYIQIQYYNVTENKKNIRILDRRIATYILHATVIFSHFLFYLLILMNVSLHSLF